MTFDNGITTGEIHIKVMCPDGSVVSTADGVVENMTGPTSKNVNLTVDGQNITKEASGKQQWSVNGCDRLWMPHHQHLYA